jgi:hypothetical protein
MISPYRCATCTHYKLNGCIALAKDTSLIDIVGCASHSDFTRKRSSLLDQLKLYKLTLEENIILPDIYSENEIKCYKEQLKLCNKCIGYVKRYYEL